jgi:DNA-binding PadR family transcriptional regulator
MNLPRLSAKEFEILKLLRSGSALYGLELVKESDGSLKRGTIYVTLGRMEEKGYVTSEKEASQSHSGLPRRTYRISGLGSKLLSATELAAAIVGSGEAIHG